MSFVALQRTNTFTATLQKKKEKPNKQENKRKMGQVRRGITDSKVQRRGCKMTKDEFGFKSCCLMTNNSEPHH